MPLAVRRSVARPIPPVSWLQHRADEGPAYLEPENPDVPAEYRELERRQWEKARRSLGPSDELWYFDNGPEKWEALCGRAGYAVVRDGVIVDAVLIRMN
jgi:hypothetical protein